MEDRDYILLHTEGDGRFDIGTNRYCSLSEENIGTKFDIKSRNLPVTFLKVPVTLPEESREKEFKEMTVRLENERRVLRKKVEEGYQTEVSVVSELNSRVITVPDEGGPLNVTFVITVSSIKENGLFGSVEVGDRFRVKYMRFSDNIVSCNIIEIISRNGRKAAIKAERDNLAELKEDLISMAGKALWTPVVESVETIIPEEGEPFEVVTLTDHEIKYDYMVKTKLLPFPPATNTHVSLWIWPQGEDGRLSFNGKYTQIRSERYAPDQLPDYTARTGTVTSILTNEKILLNVSFENNTWRNSVFRNRFNPTTRQWEPNPEIEKLLPRILQFMPLGFNARFLTDFKTDSASGQIKSRLKLCGFAQYIEGRTSGAGELRAVNKCLRERVMASVCGPYKTGNTYIITSEEYAGIISVDNMPTALVDYASTWIYTQEMQVLATVNMSAERVVVFDVKNALKEELVRLKEIVGTDIELKLCSIRSSVIYMTTEGGYPVAYKCRNRQETEFMRSSLFTRIKFRLMKVVGDELKVIPVQFMNESISQSGLQSGSVFYVDNLKKLDDGNLEGQYENLPCLVLRKTMYEDETVPEGSMQVMMTGIDDENYRILCVAHPETFSAPAARTKVRVIEEILPGIWLCKKNKNRMLVKTDIRETQLIRHVCEMFKFTFAVVSPVFFIGNGENPDSLWGRFDGIVSNFDYTTLLSDNFVLENGISRTHPKVIFGDVVLTLPDEEQKDVPVFRLEYKGETDISGALLCHRAVNIDVPEEKAIGKSDIESILFGTVENVTENSVAFVINGEKVTMSSDKELHIPTRFVGNLDRIFKKGERWAVSTEEGQWELDNNCPNWPMNYTVVKQLQKQQRPMSQRDWIVRSEDGKIALLDGRSIIGVTEGKYLPLILDEGALLNENFTYVREFENSIEGKVFEMFFEFYDSESKNIICKPVETGYKGIFKVPLENWGWASNFLESFREDLFCGSVFSAKVIRIDGDNVEMDRKCLLEEYRLVSSQNVSGTYQMKVTGITEEGYILEQADIKALLPFDKAAWFSLEGAGMVTYKDYLPVGTLVKVRIFRDTSSTFFEADLKCIYEDEVRKWLGNPDYYEGLPFTVCRTGFGNIFLEKGGVVLALNSASLGEWVGTDLSASFKVGQQLYNCSAEWNDSEKVFRLRYNLERKNLSIPEPGSIHNVTLVKYMSSLDNSCYVRSRNWTAVISHSELALQSPPGGKRPYEPGDRFDVEICEVDQKNFKITASAVKLLKAAMSKEMDQMKSKFKSSGEFIIDAKVLEISNKIITIGFGRLTGQIYREEAWWQMQIKLKALFNPGQIIRCSVIALDELKYSFSASFKRANIHMIEQLLSSVKENEDIKVKVIGYKVNGHFVMVEVAQNIIGWIPEEEVPAEDAKDWSERFKDDWVKVKVLNFDRESFYILLSRKKVLYPGIVE